MYINLHSVYVVEFSYFSALSVCFFFVFYFLYRIHCIFPRDIFVLFSRSLSSRLRAYTSFSLCIYRTKKKTIILYFILFFSYSSNCFAVVLFSAVAPCRARGFHFVFIKGQFSFFWAILGPVFLHGCKCRQCLRLSI